MHISSFFRGVALLDHRTTATLPTCTHVLVIGSGITGSFAAHFLRQKDKEEHILMLEAREACWGATGRNGGHCQLTIYASPPKIGAFELRNFRFLKDLVEENGIQCDWVNTQGIQSHHDENIILEKMYPKLAKKVKVITKDVRSPSLAGLRVPRAVGAFLQDNAASLWLYKLICWVLKNLRSSSKDSEVGSSDLQTNTPVTQLQKVDEGWMVHTPRGTVLARKVVLATNVYTSHLLPIMSNLIVPVQGEMSALIPPASARPSSSSSSLRRTYVFLNHDLKNDIYQDNYLIQRPFITTSLCKGGELMFGGGRQYAAQAGVGVSDDSFTSKTAASYLKNELNNVLDISAIPSEELKASHEWTGIMGFSRDGRLWVGEVTEELGLGGADGLFLFGLDSQGMGCQIRR
ncbi:hypothetical protein LSUB1_G001066 [Lachnellula subtilissima]|uniref:FAD dependent oxidoreductase domain-containing protein n=1 Tax=Lachnellula subtilissima TaxID=602034 RepID=A0A8H8RY46_9HELO|nr:hypothetical protein LSUB1_G001066 [Lachnellula subtilissima]